MAQLQYLKGDATEPVCKPAYIIHICNDMGGWGRGFVLAISRKWSQPEDAYRQLSYTGQLKLGTFDAYYVEPGIYVVNIVAQHGYKSSNNLVPLDYGALKECLSKLAGFINESNKIRTGKNLPLSSIHAPRIGCGNSGGSWSQIEPILINSFVNNGIDVYIYDYINE